MSLTPYITVDKFSVFTIHGVDMIRDHCVKLITSSYSNYVLSAKFDNLYAAKSPSIIIVPCQLLC